MSSLYYTSDVLALDGGEGRINLGALEINGQVARRFHSDLTNETSLHVFQLVQDLKSLYQLSAWYM